LGSTSEVIPNKAYGYIPGRPVKAADPLPYDILYSAGGIYSTGADLAKWLIALHGGRVLKPESYDEMTTADPDGFGYGLKVSIQYGQKDIVHLGQRVFSSDQDRSDRPNESSEWAFYAGYSLDHYQPDGAGL
jgi:CubicO group peptidase (beta-lactamase class C family)